MSTWKNFEIDATKYLQSKFGSKAFFQHNGGEDSTTPDILVKDKKGNEFYIEAKHCPAQCGQFVLLPNIRKKRFDYSLKNINQLNQYSQTIIEFMNKDFDSFKEAGTSGKFIDFYRAEEIFAKWIINAYKIKKVKFIITNDFKIIMLEDFLSAFQISAKYRIKRSGSRSVGLSNINAVKNFLSVVFPINSLYSVNDKVFLSSELDLHNKRFIIDNTEYMISKRDINLFEIRKLSNTFNANVIFSIVPKSTIKPLSDREFLDCL